MPSGSTNRVLHGEEGLQLSGLDSGICLFEDAKLILCGELSAYCLLVTSGSGTALIIGLFTVVSLCSIIEPFSFKIPFSFPPLESKLLGGKCLTYIGTEGKLPFFNSSKA